MNFVQLSVFVVQFIKFASNMTPPFIAAFNAYHSGFRENKWHSGGNKNHEKTQKHLADEETCEVFCGVGAQCLV